MGKEFYDAALAYGPGGFWATFHVHTGDWPSAMGPSGFYVGGDLFFDASYRAIGILENYNGEIVYGH